MKTEANTEPMSVVGFHIAGVVPWEAAGAVLKAFYESGSPPDDIKAIFNGHVPDVETDQHTILQTTGIKKAQKALPAPDKADGRPGSVAIVEARLRTGPTRLTELMDEVQKYGYTRASASYAVKQLIKRKLAKKTKPGTYAAL